MSQDSCPQVSRFLALLLAWPLSALPIFAEGSSEPGPGRSSPHLADLVVDLGHETWSRREAAQERLLGQRHEAIGPLRAALKSNNLELAYRAKYLLDMLDPLLGHFQIVQIRLGATPRVTATGYRSGKAREELALTTHDVPAPTGARRSSFQYTVFFNELAERGLEITVNRVVRGYSNRDTLGPALRDEAAISLLARTEACHYRQFGLHLERDRQRHLTLMRVRYGRASELETSELSADPDGLLETLLEELRAQSRSRVLAKRAAAVEILSYLVPGTRFAGETEDALTTSLDDPSLRPLAVLGLDDNADLKSLVSSPPSPSERPSEKLPPPRIRAASRLLERGDTSQLPLLVDRLTQDNPEHLHYIMAGIADYVDAYGSSGDGLDEEARRLLTRRIFSDGFFSHAVWQNRETAYFIDRISSLLDPEVPEDLATLEATLARLEGMVRGTSGPVRITLAVCQPIWRRLAARMPDPPSERTMLFRLLPSMMGGTSTNLTLRSVGEALKDEPLSDAELDVLLETLVETRNVNLPSAAKLLVQVLGSVQLKEGQLRRLVEEAIRLGGSLTSTSATSTRSTSALFRELTGRLKALTGVAAPRTSRDLAPWKSWLEDDTGIREQEARLIALQRRVGEGPPLTLVEFDLLVESSSRVTGGGTPPEFELVDGRALEVREGERIVYRDRWGNAVKRRLQKVKQVFRGRTLKTPPRQSVPSRPERYRFEDSHLQLTVGVPSFNSLTGRDVRSTWVETSAFFLGSRILPNRSTATFRTVTLLVEAGTDGPPEGAYPQALWEWFLEKHLLNLPADASTTRVSAVSRILRGLRIDGAGPALLRVFDRNPDHQLARDLYLSFGERKGIEYYRTRLPSLTGSRRLAAARLLAEVGEIEGADVLMTDAQRPSLISLDRFLQLPSIPQRERDRVLDFLVDELKFDTVRDEPDAKIIFATIRREANDDFGFTTAVGTNDDREKKARIRKAIEGARSWRRSVSSSTSR